MDERGHEWCRAIIDQLDVPLALNELVVENGVPKDLRLVASNPAHDRMMGRPPGTTIGRTVFELCPDGASTLLEAVVTVLETRRARSLGSPCRGNSRDITIFPVGDRVVGITDQGASGRQRAEADRERLLAEREELFRSISHDLRAPLTSISVQAQLLARVPESERVAAKARSIAGNARRMAGMIGDLVDLVRTERGIAMAPAPLALKPFVARFLERIDGGLESARIRVAIPDDIPPLHADAAKLERVLMNLLTNALRYGPPNTPVDLTAAPNGAAVVIEITDRGPGIAPDDLPRLFDRYFRATRAAGEGLGLGLHIARRFVEAHGGTIEASSASSEEREAQSGSGEAGSEEGRGATFRVTWPIAAD